MEDVRGGDDDFEGGVNEIVAMLLAARQRARVAAQIGKMAPNFLTQCHQNTSLLVSNHTRARAGRFPRRMPKKRYAGLQLVAR